MTLRKEVKKMKENNGVLNYETPMLEKGQILDDNLVRFATGMYSDVYNN